MECISHEMIISRPADEEIEVHGTADCVCASASGGRHDGCRGVPEDGYCRGERSIAGNSCTGKLMPSEVKKLRQLEEENGRLRKVVADLTLDKEMLQKVIRRKI